MASGLTNSPSPRASIKSLRVHALNPATPVHSAHNSQHSLHSSTSSRTPLQTLTLHEYRKLQNTPTSQSTPPGKSLRRKAAAATLSELERVPSIKRSSTVDPRLLPRPLHFSHSAHQLTAHQSLPPSPPLFVQQAERAVDAERAAFRSQSAEPRTLRGAAVGNPAEIPRGSPVKVSNWKPIKRLPKPPSAWALEAHHTSATAVTSLLPFPTTPASSIENVSAAGAHTTPSTFSLSQFPYPPDLIDLSFSPSNNENAPPRLNTSFATTAPATPPATPAVIHYRGTSFDLVNPHDSLLFHDIETPSRDFDSSDYLPLRTSEEPLLESEMAPRRALYANLSSAYRDITRRDESPGDSNPELPSPPPRAYLSRADSSYSSPEDAMTLGERTRRSLKDLTPIKQLARSFTSRLGKTTESVGQELQDLSRTPTSPAIQHFHGEYPRPLHDSYSTTLPSLDKDEGQRLSYFSSNDSMGPGQRAISAPLASMVPDDPSSNIGRGRDSQISASATDMGRKPYYEEVESLYPSSSIYTGDAEGGNPPSLYSKRMSKLSHGYGQLEFGDEDFSDMYNRESIYSYSNPNRTSSYSFYNDNRTSNRYSRRLTQGNPDRSELFHNDKTDTISKFIDQYDDDEGANNPKNEGEKRSGVSAASQFDFGKLKYSNSGSRSSASFVSAIQAGRGRKPTITQAPGSPPPCFAPLAPAFEYDEMPEFMENRNTSEAVSGLTSYGDTRCLLQMSQPLDAGVTDESTALSYAPPKPLEPSSSYSQPENRALPIAPSRTLEPSSSYSQPENKTRSSLSAPQEALDQAERIFEQAESKPSKPSIPAMWTRRGSGNLLRNRQSTGPEEGEGNEEDQGDWETVGNRSRRSSADDSYADFSTSEDERDELGLYGEDSMPVLSPAQGGRSRDLYCHPSPLATHEHPFSSSPSAMNLGVDHTSSKGKNAVFRSSSPPFAATFPQFQSTIREHHEEPYMFTPEPAPWAASPYALSDKETQELLNSGPNEEILYDDGLGHRRSRLSLQREDDVGKDRQPILSPFHDSYNSVVLGRENSFEKFSMLGPKGNLTGTPQGTGMNEAGSSIADNSSPGAEVSPSISKKPRPTGGIVGYYTRRQSRTSGRSEPALITNNHERTSSQDSYDPSPLSGRPQSLRSSVVSFSGGQSHTYGRSAVRSQTKLREMVLASQSSASIRTHSTHFSDLMRAASDHPASSTHTTAPLRRPVTHDGHSAPTLRTVSIHDVLSPHLSPHLRSPKRDANEEDEVERKRLSWIIFGIFCILPPLMILFRWFGDSVVFWVSGRRLGYASVMPKRVALYAGIPLNILIVVAIVVPILLMYA